VLHLTSGRKLLYAFVIAFFVTNVPIVRVEPAIPRATPRPQQAAYSDLDNPNPEVRALAVQAIHDAKDTDAVHTLLAHLDDPDQKVGLYIARALIDLAPPSTITQLQAILWNGEVNARWRAAFVLGERGDVRSIAVLVRALRDKEVLVSRYAAEALGRIDSVAGIRALISSLASERQFEVYAARRGLLALGDAAVPLLKAALESPEQAVELNASLVLQAIGTREALAALYQTDLP
jgi:HEAT repeat protein